MADRTVNTCSPGRRVTVICLCAAWCGTCREFTVLYRNVQEAVPDVLFRWLDIEDEADQLGDVDVENFPSVLIGIDEHPVFFGVITPHQSTLERLIRSATEMKPLPLDFPERAQLAALLASDQAQR